MDDPRDKSADERAIYLCPTCDWQGYEDRVIQKIVSIKKPKKHDHIVAFVRTECPECGGLIAITYETMS